MQAETFNHGNAVPIVIIGEEIVICGYDGTQVFAEGDIDWRAVVQGTHTHVEDALGSFCSLGGKPVD